ncbi:MULTISPECIES: hypothetical protein [unclassified Streptomyces]|uniref:hypothetical protein n=1 Tax=unclassified Streptomyces TaxID=2593676 RepID=UPI002DD8049B|nr:hypothetical protein [Streptomyces sp. NBC_01766]WSC20970.1 hypothetical protein OIE60_15500 [Streptomyces sp. NBC_01766]
MCDAGDGGGRAVSDDIEASHPEDVSDPVPGGSKLRRRLSCLAGVVVALAVVAGGSVWLFHDELFYPFGDSRACDGSNTVLPGVISAGGVPIPTDASEIHYVTEDGRAQVSFLSDQMPDYLHRAGLVPEGQPLLDENYGSAYALSEEESERPEGLCGPALKGPAWSYQTTGPGPTVNILVERSPTTYSTFRTPARVIASFDIR